MEAEAPFPREQLQEARGRATGGGSHSRLQLASLGWLTLETEQLLAVRGAGN